MTLATAYRNKIDALWLDFHSGGITNPITVIEQISYLMFARLLDITESRNEKRAGRLKKDFKRLFPADKQHIRWSYFRNEGGDRMLSIVRDEFFPFMRTNLQQHPLGRYLKDANCLIPSGNLLSRAVAAIEELPLTEGEDQEDRAAFPRPHPPHAQDGRTRRCHRAGWRALRFQPGPPRYAPDHRR